MLRPLKLAWYWLLAFKLACDEVLGRPQDRLTVLEHHTLHKELFGHGKGEK